MVEPAVIFVFVGLLGVFLLWCRRSVTAALVFALLSGTVAVGLVEMRSRPKPINMEWRTAGAADVLWYELDEGEALYFVLRMPQGPRFYVMPYDGEQAEQLLRAGREADQTGGTLKMGRPFEPSLATSKLFYAAPQPAPPPKG